ncbi:MAG: helix-turn-helix transcriptional regulator [Acidobacteriota bacterium]
MTSLGSSTSSTRQAARRAGERLQRHREAAGLTRTELAALAGVDRATLRSAEQGGDTRASTLLACLRALPELSPAELFPETSCRTPPASEDPWRRVRDRRGLRCERLRRRARRREDGLVECVLEVDGLSQAGGDLDEPGQRLRLMRVASQLSGTLLRELAQAVNDSEDRILLRDDGDEHLFETTSGGRGISYQRTRVLEPTRRRSDTSPAPLESGCHLAVHLPCRELELELELDEPADVVPRLVTWPHVLVPTRSPRGAVADDDLGARTHPDDTEVVLERDGARLSARVRRPPLGLDQGLTWSLTNPRRDPDRGSESKASTLAQRLLHFRERAGHSARSLGDAMGASAMTVLGAEGGRDPRRSTLTRYLEALPDLSAWELFTVTGQRPVVRRAAWHYYRDLCRCEAEEQVKRVVISRGGSARISLSTEGFRWLGPPRDELSLRLGFGRSVLQPGPAELTSVDASSTRQPLRIRRIPGLLVDQEQLLRIPGELARDGVSFTRRLTRTLGYALTERRARKRTGHEGPFREGATFGPFLPSQRLRLIVRFPPGVCPEDVRGHAWLLPDLPDSGRTGFERLLHPEGLTPEWDGRELSLSTEHALPGVKLGLSWRLPG